jgi:predicted transcriptional regulator
MSTKERQKTVMRDPSLSTGARLLWWEMTQWITDHNAACCRTQAQMAADLGVHRNTVIRWLKELRARGLVSDELIGRSTAYVLGAPSTQHV